MFNYRKKILSMAVIAALGVSASAEAGTVTFSWTGTFTLLGPNGTFVSDPDAAGNVYAGNRTGISGTLSYDTVTTAGSATIAPFSFFGSGDMQFYALNLQAIGDGMGGPGSLVLGNMSYDWNGGVGNPVSIVWDAAGFFGALSGGLSVSQTTSGVGALPASDNTDTVSGAGGTTYPIGPALLATTTWNTTNVDTDGNGTPGPIFLGHNPSGTLPLIADTIVDVTNGDTGIGGSPNKAGDFTGFNFNIDILSAHVTSCAPDVCAQALVPVPAAVWLFGSGLAGLMGLARRRRRYTKAI